MVFASLEAVTFMNDTQEVNVIIHGSNDLEPIVDVFIEGTLCSVELAELKNSFWTFCLTDIRENENPIDLHITPSHGSTQKFTLSFKKHQPFYFIDLNDPLLSFDEFSDFFKSHFSSGYINVSSNTIDIFENIKNFIISFDDKYIIWALIFIATQNFHSLLKFNESLSQFILNIITNYLLRNFLKDGNELNPNLKNLNQHGIYFQSLNNFNYNTSLPYIHYLIIFLNAQIGYQITFLFLNSIGIYDDYPKFAIPINYKNDSLYAKEFDRLIQYFIENSLTRDQIKRILLVYISTCNSHNTISISFISSYLNDEIDSFLYARIIQRRLLMAKPTNLENLKFILSQISNVDSIFELFCEEICYIPFEWVLPIKQIINSDNDLLFTIMAQNSLKHSISSHLRPYFAKITPEGSLFHKAYKLNTVSIVDGCVENGLPKPSIDPQAVIEQPFTIENGVSIGSGTQIIQNCVIQKCSIIGSNCKIGGNVRILMYSVINDNEWVRPSMEIPIGFEYKASVVELSKYIPSIITKKFGTFEKQKSGFVNLSLILDTFPCLFFEYFEFFQDYPAECGKQFALNDERINEIESFKVHFDYIFRESSLLFVVKYWQTMGINLSKVHENDFFELANFSIAKLQNKLKSGECKIYTILIVVMEIVLNLEVLLKHGIEQEIIREFKNIIFEKCDEIGVQLRIRPKSQFELEKVQKIINIVHDVT